MKVNKIEIMNEYKKLSVVIVTWNTEKFIVKCLESIFVFLENKIDFEVVIVDNNSTDKTVEKIEMFQQDKENIFLIKNKENSGFAGGNNQALEKISGDLILLLNPDTELLDDSLLSLINFLEQKERDGEKIGAVAPKLLNSDGSLQRSCRQYPSLRDQFFVQLKLHRFLSGKIKAIRKYFMLDFDHQSIKEVDQVMGAAILIPRKVLGLVGVFDLGFSKIFEEVDLCFRIKKADFQIYFNPVAKIKHHKGVSFSQVKKLKKQWDFNRCLYLFFKKHRPEWQLFVLYLLLPANLFLTLVDKVFSFKEKMVNNKDL
jgi:GT2 family glycosyltransferase